MFSKVTQIINKKTEESIEKLSRYLTGKVQARKSKWLINV